MLIYHMATAGNLVYGIHLKHGHSDNKINMQKVTLVMDVCDTMPAKMGKKYLPGQPKPTTILQATILAASRVTTIHPLPPPFFGSHQKTVSTNNFYDVSKLIVVKKAL